MDGGKQKSSHTKDMNDVNLQEHTYCQVMEESKEKDYDIEGALGKTPTVQESEMEEENTENPANTQENPEVNKQVESGTEEGDTHKNDDAAPNKVDENDEDPEPGPAEEDGSEDGSEDDDSLSGSIPIEWSPPALTSGRRKLHKTYIMSWKYQLSYDGFTKCLIDSCNFIALDVKTMREHYVKCDGVPRYGYNLCNFCHCWVSNHDEWARHEIECRKRLKTFLRTTYKERDTDDSGTSTFDTQDDPDIGLCEEINYELISEDIKYCEECDQEFLTDLAYSHHLVGVKNTRERSSRSRRAERTVSEPNSADENMDEDDEDEDEEDEDDDDDDDDRPIVQPGRYVSKGEHAQRRPYTKQHKNAWEASMEKYKYVKCMLENCDFLALSVDDMISHYGYCNGDGSFAKCVCPFCGGRLTNKTFLKYHIRKSHADEEYDENDFVNKKPSNEASQPSPSENRESSEEEPLDSEEDYDYPEEGPIEVQLSEGSSVFYSQEQMPIEEHTNDETSTESDLPPEIKSESDSQAQTWESASESSHESTNDPNTQESAAEELPQEQSPETSAVETPQGESQETQTPPEVHSDRDNKEDHIYSKRKMKSASEFESKDSLSVMKNKIAKHFSGQKNADDETNTEKDDDNENEDQLQSNKNVSGSDAGGRHPRRSSRHSASQSTAKREVLPAYSKLWSDSIRTNGFARCLVPACNFISLDVYHVENHFKNCSGVVVERHPHICKYCECRLPSSIELWVHSTMCRAEKKASRALARRRRKEGLAESTVTGESSNAAETENQQESRENENENENREEPERFKSNKDDTGGEINPRKEKMGSLRISDIIKLKDNGGMDYDRIIQPGPVLPKGHYVRRRSYTKTHKVVWKSALAKHKYVKCIFQNCHFLAMSLEDMIYHFGYCIGDGSFAKFECPYCGGRLTSKMILDIHIQISHLDKTSNENHPNKMTSNEEGEELIPYTLEDWKKLIARKNLKTYGKVSPRSKKVGSQSEETVTSKHLLETSQDDGSRPDAPALKKRKYQNRTPAEAEVDKVSDVNNSNTGSTNNEVCSSGGNHKRSKSNKSSKFQTSRSPKRCGKLRSNKTNEGKSRAGTSKVAKKRKTSDLVEVPGKSGTCKNASVNTLKTQKNICSKKENSNDEEKSSNGSATTISVVVEKNSCTKGKKTENRPLREKTETENKQKPNKNDQIAENDTESKRKKGRSSKSLKEGDPSKKEPTKEVSHNSDPEGSGHEENKAKGPQETLAKPTEVERSQGESSPKETPNVTTRKRGRPPKRKFFGAKTSQVEEHKVVQETPEQPTKGKRGRKKKCESQESNKTPENKNSDYVKCAECGFETKRQMFSDHNYKKHVGLGWIEGENPIDLNDESVVSWTIKQAFKHVKTGTCGKCGSVKKSALGFISHVQNCGKSEEEKEALKVKCPHCPARILKYSLPMHLKLSHADPEGCKLPRESLLNSPVIQPSKRKSALRAVNKFNELLRQEGEADDTKKKAQYAMYKKGVSKFPKLPYKIRSLWNKMIKEKKKIPCRRGSCLIENSTMQEARNHHFLCSELPETSYVCELCDYYTESKTSIVEHMDIHPKVDGDFKIESGEERSEEEFEMNDFEEEEGNNLVQNRLRNYVGSSDDSALEAAYKARFFARERLLNERQTRFCRRSLRMTLETELQEAKENGPFFRELHTEASDWMHVNPEKASSHYPSVEESISFRVNNKGKKVEGESNWKKLKRFVGDTVEDSAVIFTGGSVLAISWCKYSCIRSFKENPDQYLAVSSSKKMDKFQNIHKKRTNNFGLIQIYSCGEMKTLSDLKTPEMVLGIVHDYGEVWDLAWFPLDTCEDYGDQPFLTRIGLLGAACQDGTIRIWSICDPDELKPVHSLPMYRVQPKITLVLEDTPAVACMKLAIGRTGIVVGGYINGIIAVWNLKNISSPFCKTDGKTSILKPHINFQAHKTAITALAMCQNNDRYISTSGLDRFIKFWDLEYPGNPFESVQKEVCLDSVWPKHWPLTISTFENVIPSSSKGMIKSIRDIYCDKNRTPLVLDGSCWSLSFNDWLNILCGCNNFGDVKIRFMRNMFLGEEKFRYRTGSVFSSSELILLRDSRKEKVQEKTDGNSKKNIKKIKDNLAVPRTYEEACKYFGLIFHDYLIEDDSKLKFNQTKATKTEGQSLEEYPILSVTKVCWNPNYKQFLQLAIGHHCGLIRIKSLNDSKCTDEVLQFLSESEKEISKI